MTKQESEKTVYGSLITSTKCYNCIHFPLCFAQKGCENDCCYYQLKPPKDSVILSKEEYEDYKKYINTCTEEYHRGQHETELYYKNIQIPRERKETAEQIYNKIKDSFLMDSKNRYTLKLWLEKEFGIEVNKNDQTRTD